MNFEQTAAALALGAISGTVSTMLTTRVLVAVLQERLSNALSRLERVEQKLDLVLAHNKGE